MATYHLSVKFGGKGQAANHADYIERKGEYAKRKDLEYTEHGNMPELLVFPYLVRLYLRQ